jgi:hypothetical protein
MEDSLAFAVRAILFATNSDLSFSKIYKAGGPSPNWSGYNDFKSLEELMNPCIEKAKHCEIFRIQEILDSEHGQKPPSTNLKLKRLIRVILGWKKDFQRDVSIWTFQPDFRTSFFCETLKKRLISFLIETFLQILNEKSLSVSRRLKKLSSDDTTLIARDFLSYLLGVSIGQQRLFTKSKGKIEAIFNNFNYVQNNAKKLLLLQDCALKEVIRTKKSRRNISQFLLSDLQVPYFPSFTSDFEQEFKEKQC